MAEYSATGCDNMPLDIVFFYAIYQEYRPV